MDIKPILNTKLNESKELIDGYGFGGIDMHSYIKQQLIQQFFKKNPKYATDRTINFSFIQFDWNSIPTFENAEYHPIINNCILNEHNFYELTVNILREI